MGVTFAPGSEARLCGFCGLEREDFLIDKEISVGRVAFGCGLTRAVLKHMYGCPLWGSLSILETGFIQPLTL